MNYTQPRLVHTPEDLAYMAGLIDAEGSINITACLPTEYSNIVNPSYALRIHVKITDYPVIEWLKTTFGGFISDHGQMPSRIGLTPIWLWRIADYRARVLLELIYPHLRMKPQQAELAIAFQQYHETHHRTRWTTKQDIQEIIERKEAYRQQINSLHLFRKQWIGNPENNRGDTVIALANLSPGVLAYIAGLFDGEGCIYIQVRRPTGIYGKNQLRCASYRLHIQVANTYQPIIVWLHSMFGGNIQDRSSVPSHKSTQRPAWVWTVSSDRAQHVLELLEPFLKIKQRQARLAIEFQRYNCTPVYKAPERVEQKEWFREQISTLNHSPRGEDRKK